jgi:hypothetical protein
MIGGVEPVTVWAIRLGEEPEEIKGRLALEPEEGRLSFLHDEDTKTVHIPLASIRRVRRSFGSPVIQVDFSTENGVARMAFFFTRPPPVQPARFIGSGRRGKRQNIQFLMGENAGLRDVVRRWRDEVRKAARQAPR